MSETIEGRVTQVLASDDLDDYAIPPEIYDAVEDDEDLVGILRNPIDGPLGVLLEVPLLGETLALAWSLLPRTEPVIEIQGSATIVAESGTIDAGEWIEVDVAEAVVDETISRGSIEQRDVLLYEVEDLLEVSR